MYKNRNMIFENRQDAAQKLIPHLKHYAKDDVLVLAIPRGGVPLGYEVAKAYDWPLDILLIKKIGHPSNPEFAIGSVSLEGEIIDPAFAEFKAYLKTEINRVRDILRERYRLFMGNRNPRSMEGKTVIIIDDGVATGHTMFASIDVVRHHHPRKVVVAIPVAASEALHRLQAKADDVVCLSAPEHFRAVGQFYENFEQVSDEEVLAILNKWHEEQT